MIRDFTENIPILIKNFEIILHFFWRLEHFKNNNSTPEFKFFNFNRIIQIRIEMENPLET